MRDTERSPAPLFGYVLIAFGLGDALKAADYVASDPLIRAKIALLYVAAALGFLSGIGLLRHARWAAATTVGWAAASLAWLVLAAVRAAARLQEADMLPPVGLLLLAGATTALVATVTVGVALHVWRSRRTLA